MYPIDESDRLVELESVPKPEPGAPCPILLAEENRLMVSYWLREVPPYDSEPTAPFAFVRFHRPYFHLFGPPNDEALDGHPLSKCGLAPYSVYEVESSSLIRRLEAMNAIHPYHQPALFDGFHHYVFTFHDSTFECVAHGLESFVEHIHSDQQYERMMHLLKSDYDFAVRKASVSRTALPNHEATGFCNSSERFPAIPFPNTGLCD